jgi:hypothetical protein
LARRHHLEFSGPRPPQFQNEGLKVRAFFVVRATVVVHGRGPVGPFLLSPRPCMFSSSPASRAGWGRPKGLPLAIARIRKGLLIVRLLGVAGRYDAPELPLLPCSRLDALDQLQRAVQVLGPTIPSTFSGAPSKSTANPWNAFTAVSVIGPKSPSTGPGSN